MWPPPGGSRGWTRAASSKWPLVSVAPPALVDKKSEIMTPMREKNRPCAPSHSPMVKSSGASSCSRPARPAHRARARGSNLGAERGQIRHGEDTIAGPQVGVIDSMTEKEGDRLVDKFLLSVSSSVSCRTGRHVGNARGSAPLSANSDSPNSPRRMALSARRPLPP